MILLVPACFMTRNLVRHCQLALAVHRTCKQTVAAYPLHVHTHSDEILMSSQTWSSDATVPCSWACSRLGARKQVTLMNVEFQLGTRRG